MCTIDVKFSALNCSSCGVCVFRSLCLIAKQKQKLFVGVLFLEFSAGDLVGKPELSEARDLNCEDGFKFNKGEAAEQCCCCRWS
ncbi:hypothetical protein glysoja_009663 [Glycine soja]|nr:hypothetical protein glysoja_009663 [Glycine soja]